MTELRDKQKQSMVNMPRDKQLETLSQLQKMVSTGGQEMVVRMLRQVSRLLQGSGTKQLGYNFDESDEFDVSKEVRIEAYKLMIEMAAYAPV